jgi:hypothetical protein
LTKAVVRYYYSCPDELFLFVFVTKFVFRVEFYIILGRMF